MELTESEARANAAGLMTPNQRRRLTQRGHRSQALAGLSAGAALVGAFPVESLGLRLALALLGIGLSVALARDAIACRRALRALFPYVDYAAGAVALGGRGPVCRLGIAGKRFSLWRWQADRLQPGRRYAIYYVSCTRTLIGWRRLS